MNTTNNPYAEAERQGLTITHTRNLPQGIDGLYTGSEILLRSGLPQRHETSTLWHELGHHYYGITHVHKHLAPKLERRCDLYAAQHLIDPNELHKLSQMYPEDLGKVAYELGVTESILKAHLRAQQ